MRWPLPLAAALLLAGCHHSLCKDLPPPIGFPDAITLSNQHVRISISPHVGRIVDFGRSGGPNLLWLNSADAYRHPVARPNRAPYYNLGGDRLSPMLQKLWCRAFQMEGGSASDAAFDGLPWRVIEQSSHHLVIESPESQDLGIIARRRIELTDHASVVITNTLTRVKANAFPVQIWSITPVRLPELIVMDIAADRPVLSPPWLVLSEQPEFREPVSLAPDGRSVQLATARAGEGKIGSFGRKISARYHDVILTQTCDYQPAGAYPDGSNLQAYWAVKTGYCELETLSPFVHLQPGESLRNQITWELQSMPR